MYKKLISLALVIITLFSLTACGIVTDTFNSLEEMQKVLSAEFNYFDLDTEVFGEAKKFSATQGKLSDFNGTHYYSYSIRYDVKNPDNDQNYRFNVVGTHYRKPFKLSAPTIDGINVDNIQITLRHDDKSERGFPLSKKGDLLGEFTLDEFFYCFILSGTQYPLDEDELKYFKYICESAVLSRYKL